MSKERWGRFPIAGLFSIRVAPHRSLRLLLGAGALAFLVLLWWLATWGAEPESRFISPVILPSPREVVASFPSLLRERALVQGIAATLKRRWRSSAATCRSPR
jgi:ABC-type nitrate/sulfonate/bicarbonate transport system permease component